MTRTDPSARPASRSRSSVPATALVSAGSLVTGFAVAQATDVRALGGAVLLAGGVWAGVRWWRGAGPATAVGLGALYTGAFVGSHVLAREIGAWPSVLTVSAVTGAAAWWFGDRRAARR